MPYFAIEDLNFSDQKAVHVQSLLQAVRSSLANVSVSGPVGSGKSYLIKYLLGSQNYKLVDAAQLQSDLDFARELLTGDHRVFLIENIDRLSLAQQESLFEYIDRDEEGTRRRIFSTSRHRLKTLVQKGQFREDLYYRLTVLSLDLPALKDRSGDIGSMARHLVRSFEIIHNKPHLSISDKAVEKLIAWSWPGNLRELENVIERAVILSRTQIISDADIVIEAESLSPRSDTFCGLTLSEIEQKIILQTLQMTEQNRTRAAEILGISIRTLRNKINEYRQAGLV